MTDPADLPEILRSNELHPNRHRLELVSIELVGGNRRVGFAPGLNIVQGDITTGKTTLVNLIRGLLGTVPRSLPPEVEYVRALRGEVVLNDRVWQIYRPRTTSRDAPVEAAEMTSSADSLSRAFRIRATGAESSYSTFMLDQLGIPTINVPQARSEPTGAQAPVTMTDWLGYCIITGDELDTQLFGHQRVFRDAKRRWVFEVAYGYYDQSIAELNAKLRSVELRLDALDRAATVQKRFLEETPFADRQAIVQELEVLAEHMTRLRIARESLSESAVEVPGVREIRERLLAARNERAEVAARVARIEGQIKDLSDLQRQLSSQSARLTRAIVADEWLVDFDFLVCPRCGSDVEGGRAPVDKCYLCLQDPQPSTSREQLLAEQERVISQIAETGEVLALRRSALAKLEASGGDLEMLAHGLASELETRTRTFVSDNASRLEYLAEEQGRSETRLRTLEDYLRVLDRLDSQGRARSDLEAEREELLGIIGSWELTQGDAESNVTALESRMLEYLHALHIPELGQELTVEVNRNTYLPIVAGRSFDELSSQGLKTLVNIAHALAHHTVAIDRNLPLPGLLVLDGLSANAGFEGFDQERVSDVYRLLATVGQEYKHSLQIIAFDNVLSGRILLEYAQMVALNLTQEDRLIRLPVSDDGVNND
ncbi:hypothetical protein ACLQ3A_27655 [Micromonospora zamorensis]|uniref:hypothetical protein n=1 Tax=Micromonospora zamorensis TaxID=709883 RepID=UPI003CE953AB